MSRTNAITWNVDDAADRIAPFNAHGTYEILAIRERGEMARIEHRELRVGVYHFVPGEAYERFGSNRRTSAGFVWYDGEPIEFVGTWRNFALFKPPGCDLECRGYAGVFWSWIYSDETPAFYTMNASGGGRVMLLDALPGGERRWKPSQSAALKEE